MSSITPIMLYATTSDAYNPTAERIRNEMTLIGICNDSPDHCKFPMRKKLELMYDNFNWFIRTNEVITGTLKNIENRYIILQRIKLPD